jgi:GDPmannose 4,6-dehydratase
VVRDFGYAPMYVEAMWRMMQQDYLSDYLICSGNQIRLKEFVDRVFASLDLDAKEFVQTDPSLLRAVDLEVIYGDNSKAKRDLGWNYNLTNADLITRLVQDEMKFMTWQNKTALAI